MLGLSPLPRTLAAALRDVRDKKVLVRASALRDLSRLAQQGDRDVVVEALAGALRDDGMPGIRAEAAVALADAAAREVLAELVTAATEDPAPRVRQMALLALGELATEDDTEACRVIEAALDDSEPELRFQALIAVNRIAGQRAEEALLGAVEDRDAHVRYMALRLLEESQRSSGSKSDRAFARARAALDDDAAEVRLAAALFLAHAGDRGGEQVLVAAVNEPLARFEPEDEQAAIELSGELGLRAARPGLERRAYGLFGIARDPFAWQARVALARLGDQRAKKLIWRGLSAWTRDARTLAVAAAGRARLLEARPQIEAMRGQPERAEPEAVEEALQLLGEAC